MFLLILAVCVTVFVSAFCSLLEAILLSVTALELESLKKRHQKAGRWMQHFRDEIEESSSAILSLNTIANTLGAVVVGAMAIEVFGEASILYVSLGMTAFILFFAEIFPKNLGVSYRKALLPYAAYWLYGVRFVMRPVARSCRRLVRAFVKEASVEESREDEIILLANKSAREGELSIDERDMVANALHLDEVHVYEIMTPRTVLVGIDKEKALKEVFAELPDLPFARLPVFEDDISNVVGIVRRRDLFRYKADGGDLSVAVESLMQKAIFIPESARVSHALQQCLKQHQQLAVVVDEFGSVAGVVTMEDIFEYILGKEIFEQDDVAVDMRELARKQKYMR